jgi:hypothetical protein
MSLRDLSFFSFYLEVVVFFSYSWVEIANELCEGLHQRGREEREGSEQWWRK